MLERASLHQPGRHGDALLDCVSSGDPCPVDLYCNEGGDSCDECLIDAHCSDGIGCTDNNCVGGIDEGVEIRLRAVEVDGLTLEGHGTRREVDRQGKKRARQAEHTSRGG